MDDLLRGLEKAKGKPLTPEKRREYQRAGRRFALRRLGDFDGLGLRTPAARAAWLRRIERTLDKLRRAAG